MTSLILPTIDDENLGKDMKRISQQDSHILEQIAMFASGMGWHEKMALSLNAHATIAPESENLCVVTPKNDYDERLNAAIDLLKHLSPQGKVDLAVDILTDDWELGSEDEDEDKGHFPPVQLGGRYAPSTLIE